MAKRTDTIEAAGGVVWREAAAGVEVLLVHRPKYDDWSFPKGKLEKGEPALAAALREVEEETGHTCRAGSPLPVVRYRNSKGRPKVVHYWAMTVTGGSFAPNSEVDEVRWVSLPDARTQLSYQHDAELIGALVEVLATAT